MVVYSGQSARPEWDSTWKSFTFEYWQPGQPQEVTLFVNPESFSQTEPARVTVTQTKGGWFVDHFGQGLTAFTLQGTCGYKERNVGGTPVSGHKQFLELRKMYRDWLTAAKDNSKDHIMRFYNWSDDDHYEVIITSFSLQRSTNRPLLYMYNIAMTGVRRLGEGIPTEEYEDVTAGYTNPKVRAKLAKNRLIKETGFLKDIIKGVGLENFPDSIKQFKDSIAKGMEFYDSVSGVYKKVETTISEVEDYARDIEMFVNGLTTFVTKPFELVQNLGTSIGDVITQLVSVTNIPHEIVRSFREMVCAIKALPQSIFKGFTNPTLYEGASNCGTTLGIAEAPVSTERNSFAATAQVPPEREVTQIFRTPTESLVLRETPLKVEGVFLESDVERTGLNYLDSFSGNIIKLTSIPNVSIVVDYKVKQETRQNLITLETATAHIVKKNDTLVRLALKYYDNPVRWKEIALYNDLEYPYIIDTLDFEKEIKATGTITFKRTFGYTGVINIPKGHLIYAPEYQGTKQINFRTTEAVTLNYAQESINAPIEAEIAGNIGNVSPGFITGFIAISGIDSITNLLATRGGKVWRIAEPGDIIFIPKTERETISAVISAKKDYNELFGMDISLNSRGEIVSGIEQDVPRVAGVRNLVQALRNRIATSKGFYPYHSIYGTNLPIYIGRKGVLNTFNLIKIDIIDSVLNDARISEVKRFLMDIDGQTVAINFDAVVVEDQSILPVNIVV